MQISIWYHIADFGDGTAGVRFYPTQEAAEIGAAEFQDYNARVEQLAIELEFLRAQDRLGSTKVFSPTPTTGGLANGQVEYDWTQDD